MQPPAAASRAFDATRSAWPRCGIDSIPVRLHGVISPGIGPLPVSNPRVALPNFYNIAVRIANIAARLAILGLRLRDEFGAATSPEFVARLNICNADIHEAAD